MIKIIFRYCSGLLFVLGAISAVAQEKAIYIQPFEQNLSVRVKMAMPFLVLKQHTFQKTYEFKPNNPLKAGVGLTIKNTLIDFTLGSEFGFLRNKKKGKTESFDFQIHHYASWYVVDLMIQKYHGFYIENGSHEDIQLYPGIEVLQYGAQGQYVFKHEKFSYKAAFTQSERQMKNAGSALIGGSIYFTDIKPDSAFMEEMGESFHNFQFGLNGGYAYTWVFKKHWFISGSITLGVNIGNEKIKHFTKRKIEVYPSAGQRIAVGFDRENWSIGFTSVNNLTFFSDSFNKGSNLFAGNIQLTYIRRFYLSRKPFRINDKKY